jgi:cobaltochelatase CobT
VAGEGLLLAALIWLLGAALWLPRKKPRAPTPDPPAPFYHPFTTEFDRVCRGAQLLEVLAREGRDVRAGRLTGPASPQDRQQQFAQGHQASPAGAFPTAHLNGAAICLLVDQSGSMAPVMPRLSGELLAACEHFEAAGARTMLAGFTTLGWRGGHSRALWESQGRLPYPGRLSDLLHVIYSDFGEASTPALFATLLKPAIFFENIDGEAIMWAEAQLRAQDAEQRCLIVVSDGAPVDDSTLSENGPNFLWNHLVQTIADVGARGEVAIGAVGIDHRVETLYPASRHVEAGTTGALVAAIGAVAAELLSPSD